MKQILSILILMLVCINAPAIIGNSNNGTSTDPINTSINAARFLATSNQTVGTIYAKVTGSGGKYKAAIYSGSATLPSTFIRGTVELTATTNGWYSFPLTSNVSITNGQNYWLAIWSDRAGSSAYYTTGGTVRWVTSSGYSANWPTTLNTDGGATFNYCIYAQDVVVTNQPPVSTNRASVTLAWNASPDASVTGYNIYIGNVSGGYTNSYPTGNVLTYTVSNLMPTVTYYFAATARNAVGLESPFSNEVSYTPPAITNAPLAAPTIISINLTP